MGFTDNASGGKYWNVVRGRIENKALGQSHGGFKGVITGMRTQDGEYQGLPSRQLHVRMRDLESGEEIIISFPGYSWVPGKSRPNIGTACRMFLEKIMPTKEQVDAGQEIPAGEPLNLGFWQFDSGEVGKNPSTCCGVERASGAKVAKNITVGEGQDGKTWGPRTDGIVAFLITKYGGITSHTYVPDYDPNDNADLPPDPQPESHKAPDDDLPF